MTPDDSNTRRRTGDGRWEILLGVSITALVVVALVDAVAISDVGWRLAVLATAVAVVAERSADARTALGSATGAWAIGNGFLEHHGGALAWHPRLDFPFALSLLGAVAVGMCTAQSRSAWRRRRRPRPFMHVMRAAGAPRGAPGWLPGGAVLPVRHRIVDDR